MADIRNYENITSDDIQFRIAKGAKLIGYSKGNRTSYTEYITDNIYDDEEDHREFGWHKNEITLNSFYVKNNDTGCDFSNENYVIYEFPDYLDLMQYIIQTYKICFNINTVINNNEISYNGNVCINDIFSVTSSNLEDMLEQLLIYALENLKK